MAELAGPRRGGSLIYLTVVCLVATLGGLLFGYDTAVINGAIGPLRDHFNLSPGNEGWTTSCALVGCFVGAIFVGVMTDFLGRRNMLIVSALLFLVSAIGTAVPRALTTFIVFRFIGGVGVGAASMTSPLYIAEISPARIRGRMVSVNQLAIVSGISVVYFVNYFIALCGDHAWNAEIGWRWMFASEAVPASLLLLLLFRVPESPRWLTRQGRVEEALRILTRVDGADFANREMAEIQQTLAGQGDSLRLLLRPGLMMALLIGITLAILQQVTGINVFLYYGTEIFKSVAGSGVNLAMLQTVLLGIVNLTFTLIAIWTVDLLGRKPLMIVGAAGMGLALFTLGFAAYLDQIGGWLLVAVLAYTACFALSVGPVTWVILSEIFPTKVRGTAMAVATGALWLANTAVSWTFPMMDRNPWLVERFRHGFPFWIYGGFCLALVAFMVFLVPETKGKSLEEIERHWRKW